MSKEKAQQCNKVSSRYEVVDAISSFGIYGQKIQSFRSEDMEEMFCAFFQSGQIVPFDRPDAFIKIRNRILIIEHFMIDGYETYANGGSKLVSNEKRIEKHFSKLINSQGSGTATDRLGVKNSYEGFIRNCIDRFSSHYVKIPEYKARLSEEGIADDNSEFYVCFLMEDASPMGSNVVDINPVMPVCLAQSEEFLDYYINMPDVDLILSAAINLFTREHLPYILSHDAISELKNKTINYNKLQFLSSDPLYYHLGFVKESKEHESTE